MLECPQLPLKPLHVSTGVNMLSIDVECWHQIIYRNLTARSVQPMETCYHMTRSVLSLLKEARTTATFFVLGTVAETFPDLVRQIDAEGHEVATHGYSHVPITRLGPDDFRLDVSRSMDILTGILGKPVIGFRAPEFSVLAHTTWALNILVQLGIRYDSSIFPFSGRRYGIRNFPAGATEVMCQHGSLIEIPPSTLRVSGRSLPVAGGGYFRILPLRWITRAISRVNREGRAFVLYVHPYELWEHALLCEGLPKKLPRLATLRTELRWNIRRSTIRTKLRKILEEFRFAAIREVLADALNR